MLAILAIGLIAQGLILLAAAILRLGFVAQFISEPVLTGFKAGIGIVIVVDQAPKLLGLHLHKGSVLQTLLGILHGLPDLSLPTLVLSLVTIAAMVLLGRLVPRAPAPLQPALERTRAPAHADRAGPGGADRGEVVLRERPANPPPLRGGGKSSRIAVRINDSQIQHHACRILEAYQKILCGDAFSSQIGQIAGFKCGDLLRSQCSNLAGGQALLNLATAQRCNLRGGQTADL